MTTWDLFLRSPRGIPTYEAKPGMTSGVTIDLVWINKQAKDILIACLVDTEGFLNHHLDHQALVTIVSMKRDIKNQPGTVPTPEKAWYKADHPKFLAEMKAQLSPPLKPSSFTDIKLLDLQIQTPSCKP